MERWKPDSEVLGKGGTAGVSSPKASAAPPSDGVDDESLFGSQTGSFSFYVLVPETSFAIAFVGGIVGSIIVGVIISKIRSMDDGLAVGLSGSILTFLVVVVTYFILRFRKVSVLMFEHGVEFVRAKRRTRMHVLEIRDLRLAEYPGVRSGAGMDRKLKLATETFRMGLESRTLLSATDPLLDLHQFLASKCATVFTVFAERGRVLRGQGWVLSKAGLAVPDRNEVLSLTQIDFVGEFDGKVGFYRKGEQEPCVAFPSTSSNIHVLMEIVRNALKAQNRTREASFASGNLGRVLFSKMLLGPKLGWLKVVSWMLVLFAAWLIGFGISAGLREWLFGFKGPPNALVDWTITLLPQAASFTGMIFLMRMGERCVLRCHEKGIFRKTMFSERELRYEEMTAFTHKMTKTYYHGVYAGTSLSMVFECEPRKIKIRYSASVRGADADLDKLRDEVSLHVARHLLSEIKAGKKVLWGKVQMQEEGFVLPRSRWKPSATPVTVRFADVRFVVQNGSLYLFWSGGKKSDLAIVCGARNFWPCFLIMQGTVKG